MTTVKRGGGYNKRESKEKSGRPESFVSYGREIKGNKWKTIERAKKMGLREKKETIKIGHIDNNGRSSIMLWHCCYVNEMERRKGRKRERERERQKRATAATATAAVVGGGGG